jgi:hypothetical protein
MTILEELKQEAVVSEAISALGENDEELHFCCSAKQLSASKKKRRVALGLTHLALYVFDYDPGPKYLKCMQRIRTIELTEILVAKGGLVICYCHSRPLSTSPRFSQRRFSCHSGIPLVINREFACPRQIVTLCCVDELDNVAVHDTMLQHVDARTPNSFKPCKPNLIDESEDCVCCEYISDPYVSALCRLRSAQRIRWPAKKTAKYLSKSSPGANAPQHLSLTICSFPHVSFPQLIPV